MKTDKECAKCLHNAVCETAKTCDGYVSGCKHFKEREKGRMDMKEKLVELFNEAEEYSADVCCFNSTCEDCPGNKYGNKCRDYLKADHLIAHGVVISNLETATKQEWISVKDRLPEIVSTHKRYRSTIKKSVRVLCVCVQKSGKTMVKEGYCEWYSNYPEPRWQIPGTIDDVTHWQYLPQPPKGE